MRPRQRFLAIGLAVAAAEALLGVGLVGTVLGPYFFGCAAATAALAWGARRLLDPPRRDDGPGGGPDGDPEPPPWWPEFEAAFRRHVRDREAPRV